MKGQMLVQIGDPPQSDARPTVVEVEAEDFYGLVLAPALAAMDDGPYSWDLQELEGGMERLEALMTKFRGLLDRVGDAIEIDD